MKTGEKETVCTMCDGHVKVVKERLSDNSSVFNVKLLDTSIACKSEVDAVLLGQAIRKDELVENINWNSAHTIAL